MFLIHYYTLSNNKGKRLIEKFQMRGTQIAILSEFNVC
jgi:hypothetical protein